MLFQYYYSFYIYIQQIINTICRFVCIKPYTHIMMLYIVNKYLKYINTILMIHRI